MLDSVPEDACRRASRAFRLRSPVPETAVFWLPGVTIPVRELCYTPRMIAPSNLRKWLLPALTAIVLASCGAPILTQDIETIFEPGGAAGAPAYYSLTTGAGAVGVAENVFLEASKYTVKVRARIETAFIEDEVGVNLGAGFLIDAERGWILTNAHVVGWSPATVSVAFQKTAFVDARSTRVTM